MAVYERFSDSGPLAYGFQVGRFLMEVELCWL